ncbi:P44/Msp2 family outer membrane protein [Wolbachia endosymbiont of Atemnus politus]|uniref:P44/Msp2 family outer membrane protein n=1 Tax=Wolbachia endosymbiont of Atemnus politus TaxID=2682840 RepID=UPI0015731F2D|nr:P44/Msp2 family outer membrane protein [Wolbachia endosymbiont of Atemnus politus]NSM56211.1 P44/Msp2 family outer membrane protein [Wolbachia endosymbiont of Atemnus politus]NSX83540.1 P44/Msp2 family outer membrane protein [Wolbachia endosymbiont of Atemnus politus]
MHYKKFFSATALVTLLSLSNAAFSDPVGPIADEETSYYIRLQYNGEFSPFKTKIDNITVKKGDTTVTDVDPFKASFMAGGGAFGYKMDDIRVDVEGLYSQLSKYTDADITTEPGVANDLSVMSGLVNVYYDVAIEDMPITPYVGVGVGAAYVSTPLREAVGDQKHGFGFAYQAKAGVSYDITPEIKLFAGARYFGSYGAHFDKDASAGKDKREIKVLYSTVGAEAGVAFNF